MCLCCLFGGGVWHWLFSSFVRCGVRVSWVGLWLCDLGVMVVSVVGFGLSLDVFLVLGYFFLWRCTVL